MANISPDLSLNALLTGARESGVSDIHLSSGTPVMVRRYGVLQAAHPEVISLARCEALFKEGLPSAAWERLETTGDLEVVLEVNGIERYRVSAVRHRRGLSLAARVIDRSIRSFEDSGMPASCRSLTNWAQGLVLIAGPAGCGKTGTLATLVEMMNQTRADHIITIEDPIEVVFTPKKCQVSQRQVGLHTVSQDAALRAALREDPDIIVVSELRDLRTCQLAVSAAETGHLVFGTMNTNDAAQTITSLVNSFPADEQPVIRNMISESLRGVICQQLMPRADGRGMVAAYEVLMMTPAAASMIKSGRTKQLNNVIATGKHDGMVLLDDSLKALLARQIVTGEEAWTRAINPTAFAACASGKGGAHA